MSGKGNHHDHRAGTAAGRSPRWFADVARPGIVGLTVAALAGVVAVQGLDRLPPPGVDALLGLAGVVVLWRFPRLRWCAMLLLGVAWAAWRGDLAMQARLPVALEKQDIDVVGSVRELPRDGHIANRFVFDIKQATLDGAPVAVRGRARVSWYGAPPGTPETCTRWQLRLRLKRPRSLLDPGAYDSERSALERREVAAGYVRAKGEHRRLGRQAWCVDRWRGMVSRAIAADIADPRDAALLQSLAVGDTRGLDDDAWDVARANGISHLLAISGFHVGVAALFGAWLVRGLWWLFPGLGRHVPRPVAQGVAAFLTALAYGAMAGFGLPTIRTLLMIAVVALARACRRGSYGLATLASALLVILVWDPLSVLSAGFWLSFAGVAFLMMGLARPRGLVGHVRVMGLTQLLMTVALLPLTIWFFGQASLVGALSNLVAVPVVSLLVVPLALAGMVLLAVVPAAAAWLWQGAAWIMHALWWLLALMAGWPGAHWYPPMVGTGAMALAMFGAWWLFLPRGMPARWLGLVLFVPLLAPVAPVIGAGAFRAWVIDVGQGLSVLVRTRHHVLVYDTGARYPSGFDMGRVAVLPVMHALGVHRLDMLMVSHGDNDHAGGAAALVEAYAPTRRLAGEPRRTGLGTSPCRAGQHWRWDGVEMRVLAPPPDVSRRDNDASCVVLVSGAGGRLLLTGDISSRVEAPVAAQVGAGPPLVLMVPHHGSKTSSGTAFIEALRPTLAIASAGWLNRYHHPSDAVVARYRRAGVPFLDTATSGAIEVAFPADDAPHTVSRWRLRQARYWRE